MSISLELKPQKKHYFCLCHSSHEKFVLAEEFFGHGVIEFQEELVLAGDFGQEVLSTKLHGCVELRLVKAIEAIDAEVLPVRSPSDGGFVAGNFSLASFDDPLEDSDVFAKARP